MLSEQRLSQQAALFAALGDRIRLKLLTRLTSGELRSISTLSEGLEITRQSVTKHLAVLKKVGLVRSQKLGRETLFELQAEGLVDAKEALNFFSNQWDASLDRLRDHVERSV